MDSLNFLIEIDIHHYFGLGVQHSYTFTLQNGHHRVTFLMMRTLKT